MGKTIHTSYTYRCDRCGWTHESDDPVSPLQQVVFMERRHLSRGNPEDRKDLCEWCIDQLLGWLRGGPFDKET